MSEIPYDNIRGLVAVCSDPQQPSHIRHVAASSSAIGFWPPREESRVSVSVDDARGVKRMARIYCCIDPANGCVRCRFEFDQEMAPSRWRAEQREGDIINRQADESRQRFARRANVPLPSAIVVQGEVAK